MCKKFALYYSKSPPFAFTKSDIAQALIITCWLVCRTAEGSSKEAQKDVHRQNGRDEEPVEEYCCALRQLVSVCLVSQCSGNCLNVCVCVKLCAREDQKAEREKKGKCLYVCVGRGNASQTRHFVQSRCRY